MTHVHILNCGTLEVPPYPRVGCQCLLLEDAHGLALVDTGIGLLDVQNPLERIGQDLIDMAGFQFHEEQTALRQLEALGSRWTNIKHIILTHGDPDHAGGLADFPEATVHVSEEEHAAIVAGDARYLSVQFAHGPRWRQYGEASRLWRGLEARPLDLGFDSEVLLVPLFGHTLGHCGVAIAQDDGWVLHVGDAYYSPIEFESDSHPIARLAELRAVDNRLRLKSLDKLRRLGGDGLEDIRMLHYHQA